LEVLVIPQNAVKKTALIVVLLSVLSAPVLSVDISEPTPVPTPTGIPFQFEAQGRPVILYREETGVFTQANLSRQDRIRTLVESVIAGPNEIESDQDIESAIPSGTTLHSLRMPDESRVNITLDFPEKFLTSGELTGYRVYRIGKQFEPALETEKIFGIYLYAWDQKLKKAVDIQEYIFQEEQPDVPPTPVPADPPDSESGKQPEKDSMPVFPHTQTGGFLSGKTVFINQGHGWFDDIVATNRWRVQRGIVSDYGILEDFSNGETINLFTIPYLRRAGANVFPVREPDMQTNMVIVDNDDGTSNPGNGTYEEEGTWINSSLRGFKQKSTASWVGWANPFADDPANDHENRLAEVSPTGVTARAVWAPTIPESGYYNVYVSWSRFTSRATDAQYLVHHAGGTSEFRVNQQEFGFTWYLLGRFYFEQGYNKDSASVELTNFASDGYVSADAVRFGGGMGDVARRTHGVSGRPRWEEDAVYYQQFSGAFRVSEGSGYDYFLSEASSDESNGWGDRPQAARWINQYCGDSAYMAHHTNAGGGTGTRTYMNSNASTASYNLRDAIHDKLVSDIRALYDSGWVDYKNSGNYGENNQSNLGPVPGFLMETLFHDHAGDTTKYRDPKFRMILGRSFYHGFATFFANQDGVQVRLLPEPPTHLTVKNIGAGSIQVSWQAPPSGGGLGDPATGYRVYLSENGRGFDGGSATINPSLVINGLETGKAYFVQVTATNPGGESFPTETLSVGVGDGPPILLVNGYNRFDRFLPPREVVRNAGEVVWMDPRKYNTFNYSIQHGSSIMNSGHAFDGASDEAVADGDIDMEDYAAVIWIAGQEAEADTADNADDTSLKPAERSLLESFLAAGGSLFISGSEIGWDLARASGPTADEKTFYQNYLKASYDGDDAATYQARGTGGIFAGISAFDFDDGDSGTYDVRFPDQVSGVGGALTCMGYEGGSGGGAAVQFTGTFGGSANEAKLVYLGFPFESIVSSAVRDEVMSRALEFFNVEQLPPTPTPTGPTPTMTATPTVTQTPVQTDFIVDNEDGAPTFTTTGNWGVSSGYPPYYGNNCLFTDTTTGSPTHSAIFRPNLFVSGTYEVGAYWRNGSNRTDNAPYTIHHRNGSTTVRVDQKETVTAGTFYTLGQFSFDSGNAGYVELTNDANPSVIMADAVRFMLIEPDESPTATPTATETPTQTPTPLEPGSWIVY
jgi:hypothetical protein